MNPTTPQYAAGRRTLPPVSLPTARTTAPAATAEALPPELPPATLGPNDASWVISISDDDDEFSWPFSSSRVGRATHGLMHAPDAECTFADPIPNSSMLHLPTMTAPAARNRAVTVDSIGGVYPFSILDPAVVGAPRTQKLSLTAIGTPSSIEPPGAFVSPRRRRSSEASASREAVSSTPPTKALSCRVLPIRVVAALRSVCAVHSPA